MTKTLIERLKDKAYSIEYLNESLHDDDPSVFLNALRNVLEARGGLALAAEKINLSVEDVENMLSQDENSDFYIIFKILNSLGFRFSVFDAGEPL